MDTEQAQRLSIAADIVGQLFLDEPAPEMLAALTNVELLHAWPLRDDDSRSALEHLQQAASSPDSIEALQRDHLYLFIGAGAPLAGPYESPYFSPDGLVLDAAAAQVEAFYAAVGFHPAAGAGQLGNLPPDHLGLELRCVAHVAARIAAAPTEPERQQLAAALRRFVSEHPARFAEHVLAGVTEHARTDVYRALPGLTRGVLRAALG